MVKVYQARVWNPSKMEHAVTKHKWTLEAIVRVCDGLPLLATEEEVAEDALDGDGQYIGRPKSPWCC